MSRNARFVFVLLLLAASLACGLITNPITSGAQNLASTAEAAVSAIPSGLPNLPDVTGYLDPTGAPVSDWNGIPVMPQATAGQEFNANTYSFKVGSTPQADIEAFYNEKLKTLGWSSVFSAATGSVGGFMMFSKDSNVITITTAKADQDTVVLLIKQ
jgi:hypothetical protein